MLIYVHYGIYFLYYTNEDFVFVSRVLIEGVKYYASEPWMLGRTFLRLVRNYVISSLDVVI
jgi:hypothetical protein